MTNPKLAVSASVIRYLLALDALKGAGGIRTTDVARYLNIKKPSAHTMLNNLKDAEILTKDELGIAHLTGYGVELTQKYRRYYSRAHPAACGRHKKCSMRPCGGA